MRGTTQQRNSQKKRKWEARKENCEGILVLGSGLDFL